MIPLHGRINCSVCFNGSSTWGESISEDEGWRLENNPCAWGSATPKVLILGFSKGYNQTTNLTSRDFNDIPFSGWRDRLDLALRKVGVLPEFLSVNEKISDSERNFAFGSLIRCSISKYNNKSGKYEKTGNNIISSTFRNRFAGNIACNCVRKFLTDLPDSLKLVVLLGNDSNYMEYLKELIGEFYPNLQSINEVAYKTNNLFFVHITHPSPGNGHFFSWLNSQEGVQAHKRELAIEAVRVSGILESLN